MSAKSYTQWSMFNKCGAQYKYRYIERIPRPKDDGAAAQRGTNIHECVEHIIQGKTDQFPEEFAHLEHYEPFFQSLREKGAIAELPFTLTQKWEHTDDKDDMWVRGFIDVIVPPTDDRPDIYIYELKTGNVYPDHVGQRHFYGTVALHLYPDAPQVHVIGTYLDKGVNEGNIYPRSMVRTYDYMWANRMALLDKTEAHVPDPGFHCRWCPYSADKAGPCKFSGHG